MGSKLARSLSVQRGSSFSFHTAILGFRVWGFACLADCMGLKDSSRLSEKKEHPKKLDLPSPKSCNNEPLAESSKSGGCM